jgi:hypothetical protein
LSEVAPAELDGLIDLVYALKPQFRPMRGLS